MSEPTYRVDLTNDPTSPWPWRASVVRLSDEQELRGLLGETREGAFELALAYVVALKSPERASSVYLSEDGDLLDPHEVQR